MAKPRIRRISDLGKEIVVVAVVVLTAAGSWAAQVSLSWDPNSESNLAGYRIHYGTARGAYATSLDVHNATTCTVTGLTPGQTYYFAATAYDTAGNSSGFSNEVSYAVPAVNGAPTTPTIPSGVSNATLNTGYAFSTSASDPDGNSVEYRYDWGGGVLSAWGAASQIHSWSTPGVYTVKAQARDSLGAISAWSAGKAVTVSANQPPTANAGTDKTVAAGSTVTLTGGGSDPEGSAPTYQWRQTAGQAVTIANAMLPVASFVAPNIATGIANLVFELKVTDGGGLSTVDTVSVTVQSPDIDGDGVPNNLDAFPYDAAEWKDSDGDGIGDNADPDDNNNGIPDTAEGMPPSSGAPYAPILATPKEDAAVSTQTVLTTEVFKDPNPGDTHARTRWQVFRDADSACLLDITSSTALTRLVVPRLVLDEGVKYFWRAQFVDSTGKASEWSNYGHFATQTTGRDRNVNGIPDSQEVPPDVDLDRDGVKDIGQARLKAVRMEGSTAMIAVSIKNTPTAIAIKAVESQDTSLAGPPVGAKPSSMPFGLLNFKITVANPGDQATVRLYFSERAPRGSRWYKYDSVAGRWYDFTAYASFAPDRRSVSLTLKDGGAGDADGVANGVIVDPSGFYVLDANGWSLNWDRPWRLRQTN